MGLSDFFTQTSAFHEEDSVYFHNATPRKRAFEQAYLGLRQKEKRLLDDSTVASLPDITTGHPLHGEWLIRKVSAQRLAMYLTRSKGSKTILDLGCGNGWLSHHLAVVPGANVLAMDVNEEELKQGARVFSNDHNLVFCYADISRVNVSEVDYVVLGSSLQYFENVEALIRRLLTMLSPQGEIHIIDTPVYNAQQVPEAKQRSSDYFETQGAEMKPFYFHHHWEAFSPFKMQVLYNPSSLVNRLSRTLFNDSPFPWLRIAK